MILYVPILKALVSYVSMACCNTVIFIEQFTERRQLITERDS